MSFESTDRSRRFEHLELLRIIACFLVILNHTSGYINCFVYDKSYMTPGLIFDLFIGMLVKINVPIFFMITGTLLLSRDRDYRDIFKRAAKTFGILLLFSLVANFCNQGHIYIPGFIRGFATAKVDGAGPYWYLYAYIGILLMIPFLRSIAARLSIRDVIYIIIARIVITGIIPMIFLFLNLITGSNIYLADDFNPVIFTVDCVFYPIVGFGLDRLLSEEALDKLKALWFILLFLAANFIEIFLTWIAGLENVYRGYDFLMAIGVFMCVKLLYRQKKSEKAGLACAVGGLTFGIYLLDPIVGNFLKPIIIGTGPDDGKQLLLSFVYCLVSMIICGFATFIYKQIKKSFIK